MTPSFQHIYQQQQQFFQSGVTRTYAFRKAQLQKLDQILRDNEKLIEAALYKDLKKHPQEVYMTEVGPTYEEIKIQLNGIKEWMRPKTVGSPIFLMPSTTKLYPHPVGNVMVIAPWNYPILLTFRAVAGAIAAGNTVVIKPSEISSHTSLLIAKLINENFDHGFMYVVNGEGHTVLPEILEQFYFGHIMFTGSTAVGKLIMGMAAKQLSPVSLELGGKSPCIVDKDASIELAAKRIVWGKLLNCGQTCVAPDYLVVHHSVKDVLITAIIEQIETAYGKNIAANDNYGRIINQKRFNAITKYLTQGTIIYGGATNEKDLFISPTIMENIAPDAALMQEEIFGPVLPVFTFHHKEEVLELIAKNPNPLSFYLFTTSKATEKYFIEKVAFGGGCINETVYHLGNSNIPFGGIGNSGHGGYLGKFSFDMFTHYKGVVKKYNFLEPFFRFAPFNKQKLKLWKLVIGRA